MPGEGMAHGAETDKSDFHLGSSKRRTWVIRVTATPAARTCPDCSVRRAHRTDLRALNMLGHVAADNVSANDHFVFRETVDGDIAHVAEIGGDQHAFADMLLEIVES